jgi:hypothetical protein
MKSGSCKRFWLTLALGIGIGTLALALPIGYVLHQGTIELQVQESGPGGADFSLKVPVVLLDLGLHFVPDAVANEMNCQSREHLELARAACRGLRDASDGVFVRVEAPGEMIRIAKQGGKLQILVEDGEGRVRVSVPLKSIAKLLDEF